MAISGALRGSDSGLYEAVDIAAQKTTRHRFSASDDWFVGNAMVLRRCRVPPLPIECGRIVIKEFKDFIMRGNVVDLAVAVVIGAAFGAVVTAFVASFITPLIAAIGGKPDFSALAFTINGSRFTYGSFFNALLSFLIIAFVIFLVIVKPMNALQKRAARKQGPASDAPAEDIVLLTEIRDELRSRSA